LCRIVCEKTLADFERYLAGKGIVIRNCSNYPGLDRAYFRVAVRTARENGILAAHTARFF
jgi:threonine-phosphate decarboxylase